MVRALERVGFAVARRRGSHVVLKLSDGRATVVPVHRGESLGAGLLSKIARDIGLTGEELFELFRR